MNDKGIKSLIEQFNKVATDEEKESFLLRAITFESDNIITEMNTIIKKRNTNK